MSHFIWSCLLLLIFVSISSDSFAQNSSERQFQRGPFSAHEAPKAPEWEVTEWVVGEGTTLSELQGKVVVIDFFQLWCPGCNKFSIPLMSFWEDEFKAEIEAGKLVLISIHTVFEGHSYQTVEKLRTYVKEKKIRHPVGVDRHADGKRLPETMIRYNTNGTPEMAFIDKKGRLRFQKFGYFDPDWATKFVRDLMNEAPTG